MLSKEKILSASVDDFMNDDQLQFMRNILLRMRDAIRFDSADPCVCSVSDVRVSDEVDQAQQEQDWMVSMKMRALESDLLSDIEKALYKVDSGEYGYCEQSGEPIDIRRLLAFPTSSTTVEEQQRQENISSIRSRTHVA